MNTTTTAKSLAPGASDAIKVAAGEVLFPTITVVAHRSLRDDQSWFEGDGRGYVREFIVRDGEQFCTACNEAHDLTAFPTFSVPRQNGRTRSTVCRDYTRQARRIAAEKAARQARTAKARAALAAKRAAAKA